MDTRFTPPEYHTPATKGKSLKQRLIPGPSIPFFWDTFIGTVLWGRRRALQGKFSDPQMAEGAEKEVNSVEDTGAKLHVTGIQHLAESRDPVVFVGNHMSALETLILPAMIYPYKECSFVVKKILVDGKIFGPIMRQLQPIAVGRDNPREDLKNVLNEGTALLKKNRSVFIFPQTTRSADFDPANFNTLGAKLAKRAGVKLIPVALKTDFWVPGKLLRDFGTIYPDRDVHAAFGPPIEVSGNGREAHEQAVDFIGTHLKEWGVECKVT